jgi:hypothetical protein
MFCLLIYFEMNESIYKQLRRQHVHSVGAVDNDQSLLLVYYYFTCCFVRISHPEGRMLVEDV